MLITNCWDLFEVCILNIRFACYCKDKINGKWNLKISNVIVMLIVYKCNSQFCVILKHMHQWIEKQVNLISLISGETNSNLWTGRIREIFSSFCNPWKGIFIQFVILHKVKENRTVLTSLSIFQLQVIIAIWFCSFEGSTELYRIMHISISFSFFSNL